MKIPLGKTFQAIVSVIAVKTQFNSPYGVLLSGCLPGGRRQNLLQNQNNLEVKRQIITCQCVLK